MILFFSVFNYFYVSDAVKIRDLTRRFIRERHEFAYEMISDAVSHSFHTNLNYKLEICT